LRPHCYSRKLGKYWCLVPTKTRQGGRHDIGLKGNRSARDQKAFLSHQRGKNKTYPFSKSKSQYQNITSGWVVPDFLVFLGTISNLKYCSKIRCCPRYNKRITKSKKILKSNLLAKQKYTLMSEVGSLFEDQLSPAPISKLSRDLQPPAISLTYTRH
jgi:hypothetical protein